MSDTYLGAQTGLWIEADSGLALPDTPHNSYSTAAANYYLADATTRIDIRSELVSIALTGVHQTTRRPRLTSADDILGQTADILGCGWTAVISLLDSADVTAILEKRSWYLIIERIDADRMIVIPLNVGSAAGQRPAADVQTVTVNGTQNNVQYPVEGPLSSAGDTVTYDAARTAYKLAATGIEVLAADDTLSAGETGVAGNRYIADNSRPAPGALYELTGTAQGIDNLTSGDQRSPTPVPGGRGVIATQPDKFAVFDFGVAADSNPRNDLLLRDAHGTRRQLVFAKQKGSGNPQWTSEACLSMSLNIDVPTDRIVWTSAFMVDGKPTKAQQA